ncbi:MAG TPA: hypothetical protein VK158_01830 [Acidobacteriota bacterium]|nr:hypothetical protein [Acidobacteriota bacterium]
MAGTATIRAMSDVRVVSERSELRTFLIHVLAFALIFACMVSLVNLLYIQYVIPQKIVFQTNSVFDSVLLRNDSLQYVFVGDSHPYFAIDAQYISNSVNLASISENYAITYHKLRILTERRANFTHTIVLQVDPHSFRSEMLKDTSLTPDNIYFYSQVVPFATLYSLYENSNISLLKFLTYRWLPSVGNGIDFLRRDGHIPFFFNIGGDSIGVHQVPLNEMKESAVNRVSKKMSGAEFEPLLVDFYTAILSLAKENNISVILIVYPHSKEFDEELVRRNISLDSYYQHIDSMTQEVFVQGYTVLNYYDYFFNDSSLMYDADHITKEASALFSADVADRLTLYERMNQ